jgi:hypothetical protein
MVYIRETLRPPVGSRVIQIAICLFAGLHEILSLEGMRTIFLPRLNYK